jgi:uncharacterized protein
VLTSAESWYIDSSALVKTIVAEAQSPPLMAWLDDKERLVSCDLIRVETVRAVRLSVPEAVPRARAAVARLTLIRLDEDLYEAAADLDPPLLRLLDALHLAAALSLGSDLGGVVTYDRRMADGAVALGLHVEAPA